MKNITRLLNSLNNNCRNFCPILSSEWSIFSEDNVLSGCQHLFHIFYLKFPVLTDKLEKL